MFAKSRQSNLAWCPACGQAYELAANRLLPSARPTRRERPLECPRCGCGQCRPREKPRLSRRITDGGKLF